MRRVALLALLAVVGCDQGDAGRGLGLWLRAAPGQLVWGPLPADARGPAISAVDLTRSRFAPGEAGFEIGGRLGAGGVALRLMLEGDSGHWIVPGGFVDAAHPDEIDWRTRLELSPVAPEGARALLVQATDDAGRAGPPTPIALTIAPDVPTGDMLVTLSFDADADVDLRVRTPTGAELDAVHGAGDGTGAFVDHDANAGCRVDGRRREVAVWPAPPGPGRYTAFVALASACGVPRVGFAVDAQLGATSLGRAAGVLYPEDARRSGRLDAPPGLMVLSFDVP